MDKHRTLDRRSVSISGKRRVLTPSNSRDGPSPNFQDEIAYYKENLSLFDEDSKSLLKSMDRYAEATKAMLEAERSLAEELRKLSTEQTDTVYGPMKPYVGILIDECESEISSTTPFLEMLNTYTKSARKKVDQISGQFKKRIADDTDREILHNDLSVWWEQRKEIFDPCIIMIMKERSHRQTYPGNLVHGIWNVVRSPLQDEEEVDASSFSFQRVYKDPTAIHYLRQFLIEEHSLENLEFLEHLDQLKMLRDEGEIKEAAKFIEEHYLREGSPNQVNLSAEILKRIESAKNNNEKLTNVFDPALIEVIHLIEDDSFPRFKKSVLFQRMVKRFTKPKRGSKFILSPLEERHTVGSSPSRKSVILEKETTRKRSNTLQGFFNRIGSPTRPSSPAENRSSTLLNGEILARDKYITLKM